MSINSYMHDLENVQDLYQLHWVIPYGSCYAQAHSNYLRTMSQQAATNKLKMEMLMLVASVGFGGAMSGLFGTAVVRTAVSAGALNTVCNRNMTRVFNAMAWVEGSAAASHMTSAAWDGVASMVTTQTKNRITSLATANPVGSSLQNPQVFQNDLQAYVLAAKTAAYELAAEIRDNFVLSDQRRNVLADQLRAAPFFASAPHSSVIANTRRATKEIELLLYMIHIMNSDYIREVTPTGDLAGGRPITRTRRLGGIELATSSRSYPTDSSSGGSYRTVEYDRPGGRFFSDIMDKTNALHSELYGRDFERGSFGHDEVARAENLSRRIQQNYFANL